MFSKTVSYYDRATQFIPHVPKVVVNTAVTAAGIAAIALVARWYPLNLVTKGAMMNATGKVFNATTLNAIRASMNYVGKATLTTIIGLLTTAAAAAVCWGAFVAGKALSPFPHK